MNMAEKGTQYKSATETERVKSTSMAEDLYLL